MTITCLAHDSTRLRRAALTDVGSAATGIIPFGLMLGITSAAMHSGGGAAVLGALVVFGGSAQLATISMLHTGAGLVAALVSGLVVNARLLLYSAALEPRFRGHPWWFRLVVAHLVQDQTYLAATSRPELDGREFRYWFCWLSIPLVTVWTASVGAGVLLAPMLPALPHLVLVGTTLFVAMLAPKLRGRTAVAGALVGAGVAVAVTFIRPELGIIAGATAGVLVSMLVERETAA